VREGRRFHNALKLSGLPHHKGLDAFDFAFQPDLDARMVRDLATLGFVQQKPTWHSSARPGSARPMLAVGLAIAACQAGSSVYFTTLDDLVRNLNEAEASAPATNAAASWRPPTRPSASGVACSAMTCWPRPSWTGCCTTATSSRSTGPAIDSRTGSSPRTEVVPSSDDACPATYI
jgi:IstB-like ATP binding protein